MRLWRWLFGKKPKQLGLLPVRYNIICVMCRNPFELAGHPGNYPFGMMTSKCCGWPPRVDVDKPTPEGLRLASEELHRKVRELSKK